MTRWVGAQGQVTSAKNAWTYPSYEVIDKKMKSKTFQFKNLKTLALCKYCCSCAWQR